LFERLFLYPLCRLEFLDVIFLKLVVKKYILCYMESGSLKTRR